MVPNLRVSSPPMGHKVNLGCHEMINVVEKENSVLLHRVFGINVGYLYLFGSFIYFSTLTETM